MADTTVRAPGHPLPEVDVETAGEWVAIHIFYMAKARPMVKLCVKPLIEDLCRRSLLANYFFMHYWVEGPHLRLRLRPATPADAEEVRRRAEEAITKFLAVRPALYDMNEEFFVNMHDTLFKLEYGPEEQKQFTDENGRMRKRANNSYSYERYEPEYGKYGGEAGIDLAEWHFRHSSDLVMQAVSSMNLHLRTVALGLSAQLMVVMTTAFLRERERTVTYLRRYHDFWHGAFEGTDLVKADDYEKTYSKMSSDALSARFHQIQQACLAGQTESMPRLTRFWFDHCVELRRRVADLVETGRLSFPNWTDGAFEVATDVDLSLDRLLSPYMHMTNNRLEVSLADEAYLSYVLARTLDVPSSDAVPGTPS